MNLWILKYIYSFNFAFIVSQVAFKMKHMIARGNTCIINMWTSCPTHIYSIFQLTHAHILPKILWYLSNWWIVMLMIFSNLETYFPHWPYWQLNLGYQMMWIFCHLLLYIVPVYYYMLFSYQTGYIMWHSRLRMYIPWGCYMLFSYITDLTFFF